MKKSLKIIIPLLLIISACRDNRWNIDVKNEKIDLVFYRFDQDLFSLNKDSIWKAVPMMKKKYGSFFDLYNLHIINIGSSNELNYDKKLNYFLNDPDIYGSYVEANKKVDETFVKTAIENAFKHYHYYFPERVIPEIYTHISGFNQSIVIDSFFMSIALDKYLGADNKYYQMLRTPLYKRANMYPQKIPTDALFAWGETEFVYQSEHQDLLSYMIYYGKLHTFLDAIFPQVADTLKWGYSAKQLDWCKKNEQRMWLYLVENKQVFSSSAKEIKMYINDAPFTSNFSKQSSPRTGRWIGYKIVQSYLKQNPEITLTALMNNNDFRKILNQSKYKP